MTQPKENSKDAHDEQALLLSGHDADGIQELDNLLPRWWVWLFYLCIVFSVAYMGYYHVLKKGDLQAAEYAREKRLGEAVKNAALASFESNLGNLKPEQDKLVLSRGQTIYGQMCAPCHRADGGGLVGPNLTDDYWIHGGNYTDTLKTIVNGVPEKGMLSWKSTLKPGEIQAVASFIFTLRGTKPPNAKAREDQAPAPAANEYE
jgi:cytochrome c oxidase cbb3-type subunit 3